MKTFLTSAILGTILITTLTGFTGYLPWYKFVSKKHGYQIEFPVKPEITTKKLKSDIGTLKLNIASYDATKSKKDQNMVYMINHTEYPASITSENEDLLELFFKGAIKGAVSKINGKKLSEEEIDYKGYPGREVKIDYNDGAAVIKLRLFLVKNHLYMIQVITATDNDENSEMNKFLNSFDLI